MTDGKSKKKKHKEKIISNRGTKRGRKIERGRKGMLEDVQIVSRRVASLK